MEKILCYSCNKSKNNLVMRKSVLLPINLFICETCNVSKFEPRWVIILSARQNGLEHIKDYILKKKYIGKEIAATEVIV
jgi:NMD protein affecting ribosome stability and mRNA decay